MVARTSGPFDRIQFTISDLQEILFGKRTTSEAGRRQWIRNILKQMGFQADGHHRYVVANPRQFMELVCWLERERDRPPVPKAHARKGQDIRALPMAIGADAE